MFTTSSGSSKDPKYSPPYAYTINTPEIVITLIRLSKCLGAHGDSKLRTLETLQSEILPLPMLLPKDDYRSVEWLSPVPNQYPMAVSPVMPLYLTAPVACTLRLSRGGTARGATMCWGHP